MNVIKNLTLGILICLSLFTVNQLKGQSVELENVAAELGDTVLVPLNFSGLQNLGAILFYIIYNPASIEYLGMENIINEADGIISNGSYQPLCDTTAIGISWTASTNGVNFPDGKVLDLKVVFNNTYSDLNFYVIYCEIADWDANIMTVSYTNGGVYINQGATESVWTGIGDWTSETNWSNGIPGAITRAIISDGNVSINSSAVSNKLIINNGANLFIHPNYALTVFDSVMVHGSFTIKSDDSGTGSFINMGEVVTSGSVIVERFLTGHDHFVSSPVANSQASVFANATVSAYNEPGQTWEPLLQTDVLGIAEGYKVTATTDETYSFSGNFNYGNYFVDELSLTETGLTSYPNGLNLCGNPFPSAISWDAGSWIKNMVDASIYTWNGSQYISWNGEIGSVKDGVIPSAQGFIVFANEALASVEIPNDARIHNQQPYYSDEKDISNMVQFSVSGNGFEDRSYLQFKYDSHYGFDHEFDAYKLFGLTEAPQLYTFTNGGEKVSINVIPDINTSIDTAIRIGFESPVTDEYQIVFEVNSFSGVYDLHLVDSELDSIQSLSTDSVYVFNSEQGLFEERFLLYFKKPSRINDSEDWNVKVYAHRGILYINLPEFQENIDLEIYGIDGRLILSRSLHQNITFQERLNGVHHGVYIVRLTSDKKVYSGKLFLK